MAVELYNQESQYVQPRVRGTVGDVSKSQGMWG